jgi:hypothetical protein
MGVVVPQIELLLPAHSTLLPELLDQQNPGQFPVVKPIVERFQPVNLLPHGVWNPLRPLADDDLDRAGQQAQHALVLETALELAHRVWMGLGFVGPLHGRAISKQHEGANHFIAPLGLIHEAQLQLRKLRCRVHRSSFR